MIYDKKICTVHTSEVRSHDVDHTKI